MTDTHGNTCVCGHVLAMHDDSGCVSLIYGHDNSPPTDCGCEGFKESTELHDFKSA